jgi:hypothetical protein
MIEERNKQEDVERMEHLSNDKEEAMKLMMQSRVDPAASVNALLAANNTKAMTMVAMDDMLVISEVTEQTNANNKPTIAKKVKDPNAPKQASNSYIFFTSENRKSIKASMPEGTNQRDLLTEVGRQWRELTEDKKAKYLEMANEDKERYAKEMEKYTAEKK